MSHLPPEIDDYIKESIDQSLGFPVSTGTLESKLSTSDAALQRLRDQCAFLQSKLKEKDLAIKRARAEATMNALALKKFVERNQKLSLERSFLLTQCKKWKRGISLNSHDREALTNFGNEAERRGKEADVCVRQLEEKAKELSEDLHFFKHEYETRKIDSSFEGIAMEGDLLESVLAVLIGKTTTTSAHALLEANIGHESCRRLLDSWERLRPSTQKALSLAAEIKTLEKDKEHLTISLHRAEGEVRLLSDGNKLLVEENKTLLGLCHKERGQHAGGKPPAAAL